VHADGDLGDPQALPGGEHDRLDGVAEPLDGVVLGEDLEGPGPGDAEAAGGVGEPGARVERDDAGDEAVHAAAGGGGLERVASGGVAAADDDVGVGCGGDELGDVLRPVLAVAVELHDRVVALARGELERGAHRGADAEVDRVRQHGHAGGPGDAGGLVAGAVVDDDDV